MDTQLSHCYENNRKNNMSVQQRRKYDPDFKKNAVLLSEEEGRTVTEVARNLGISMDILFRWRREYRSRENFAFPGHGRESLTEQERIIRELEKELHQTKPG
jgi:transposase-like protein